MHRLKLLSGYEIPIIGLGTWRSKPGEVANAVRVAIEGGYRHIDCAHIYQNEREVGVGIKECLDRSVVKREELFVTSKLWCTMMRSDLVLGACKKSLENLGLDFLDLYLIHWPFAFQEDGELLPKDADDKVIFSKSHFMDTWKEMEKLVDTGLVRSIGISNFNSVQVQQVWDSARIKPSVLQIEVHPYNKNIKLVEFAKGLGLQITAYSPLGSPESTPPTAEQPGVLKEPLISKIAARHGKSAAQVLIRYCIDRDLTVIPKSVTKKRIEENFQVFDFQLSKEEMDEINSLPDCHRTCLVTWASKDPQYPFNIPF